MITDVEKQFLQESNEIENVRDVDSLDQAIYAWEYLKSQEVLDTGVVLKTHKILMLHQPLQPDEKGYFRKVPVYVGRREGMPWGLLPQLVARWCEKVMANEGDPVALHVLYEKIHPFVDGNGRTGRMFLNWHRLKLKQDILVIKESEKREYYKWFYR